MKKPDRNTVESILNRIEQPIPEWGESGRLARVTAMYFRGSDPLIFTLPVKATSYEDARAKAIEMIRVSNPITDWVIIGIEVIVKARTNGEKHG